MSHQESQVEGDADPRQGGDGRVRTTSANGILHLTLARPDSLNALSDQMWDDLESALTRATQNQDIRGVIVRGEGVGFCAGEDRQRLERLTDHAQASEQIRRNLAIIESLATIPIPTVSIVHGVAHGVGMLLATVTDYVVATSAMRMRMPEARLGIVDSIHIPALTNRLGPLRAKSLILAHETIDASDAHEWGLVNHVSPDIASAENEAHRIMERFLEVPHHAYASIKDMIVSTQTHGAVDPLLDHLRAAR